MTDARVKRLCSTLNNYSEEHYEFMKNYASKWAVYAIIGKETAPTTGTPHLQGYM